MCRPTSLSCVSSRHRLELPLHYYQLAEEQLQQQQLLRERQLQQLQQQLQHQQREQQGQQQQPQQSTQQGDSDHVSDVVRQHQPNFLRYPVSTSSSSLPLRDARLKDLTDYQRFLVFMKIMFKIIEQTEMEYHSQSVIGSSSTSASSSSSSTYCALTQRAKRIVDECTRRSKMGDENYLPLQDAVIVRLRCIVSEIYWNLTRDYLGYSCD